MLMRVYVLVGWVREIERLGNDAAGEAADSGRRRVSNAVVDARCNLSGVCGRWYPVILDLHRFFIAISRAVVNHDGRDGTAPDPLCLVCWCPPQEAPAGSCGSGRGISARATLYLGFRMGCCACFCDLC